MPDDKQGFVEITEEGADIYTLPEKRPTSELLKDGQRLECVIGDLHANAMKLIWFLVREGVITNLDEKKFNRLKEIFQNGSLHPTKGLQGITREEIKEFNDLIEGIEFNPAIAVKLIGDDLCDRVGNDYFILKILSQLSKKEVPLEILLSNHSIEFIDVYEKSFNEELIVDNRSNGFFPSDKIGILQDQSASSFALRALLEQELVDKKEVSALYNEYKKNIRALSYSLLPDGRLVIYSHAPINLDVIKLMAAKVKVEYLDTTALELAKTIDRINEKVKACAENNRLHKLYTAINNMADMKDDPFMYLMWNTDITVIPPISHHFVHGHTKEVILRGPQRNYTKGASVTNLDNEFGKMGRFARLKNPEVMSRDFIDVPVFFGSGTYTAVTAINTQAPQLAPVEYSEDLIETGSLSQVVSGVTEQPSGEILESGLQVLKSESVTQEQLNHDLKLAVKSLIDQIEAFEGYINELEDKNCVDNPRYRNWTGECKSDVRECFLKVDPRGDIELECKGIRNFRCMEAEEISPEKYEEFKTKLTEKLNINPLQSGMNYTKHRKFYKVVLANIAIALTGIGAILLAAHAIHDRVKKGSNTSVNSALFFGHTRREKMRDKMESTFEEIKKHVSNNGRQVG